MRTLLLGAWLSILATSARSFAAGTGQLTEPLTTFPATASLAGAGGAGLAAAVGAESSRFAGLGLAGIAGHSFSISAVPLAPGVSFGALAWSGPAWRDGLGGSIEVSVSRSGAFEGAGSATSFQLSAAASRILRDGLEAGAAFEALLSGDGRAPTLAAGARWSPAPSFAAAFLVRTPGLGSGEPAAGAVKIGLSAGPFLRVRAALDLDYFFTDLASEDRLRAHLGARIAVVPGRIEARVGLRRTGARAHPALGIGAVLRGLSADYALTVTDYGPTHWATLGFRLGDGGGHAGSRAPLPPVTLDRIRAALGSGRHAEVVRLADAFLAQHPGDAEAVALRGAAATALADAQAKADREAAARRAEADRHHAAAMTALEDGRLAEALDAWRMAESTDPSHPFAKASREGAEKRLAARRNELSAALSARRAGDHAGRIADLEALIRLDPSDGATASGLAHARKRLATDIAETLAAAMSDFQAKRYDTAEAEFSRVLALAPAHRDATAYLDESRRRRAADEASRAGEAIAKARAARDAADYTVALRILRGLASAPTPSAEAKREFEDTLASVSLAVQREAKDGSLDAARTLLAQLRTAVPDEPVTKTAADQIESSRKRRIEKPKAAGLAAYADGRLDEALAAFDAAAGADPGDATIAELRVKTRVYRGIRLFREEKIEAALADWESALKLDPHNESAEKYAKRARTRLERLRSLETR